jgi:hypothetical protein
MTGNRVSKYTGSPGRALRVEIALCNTSGMCVPPGTSTFAFAFREIGVAAGAAALPAPVEAVAADEPEGCAVAASVEGRADGDDAAGFCPAGVCAEGGGAGGKGPSCCARAEPASARPRNARTTAPANCRRSELFLMCCPPTTCPRDASRRIRDVPGGYPL